MPPTMVFSALMTLSLICLTRLFASLAPPTAAGSSVCALAARYRVCVHPCVYPGDLARQIDLSRGDRSHRTGSMILKMPPGPGAQNRSGRADLASVN